MQTTMNGSRPAPLPVIERYDPAGELDLWDEAIADLSLAMRDAAEARAQIDALTVQLDRLEAGAVLAVEGKNESERKARLTLALADDARYETCRQRLAEARQALWDAERRVAVTKERCRLLRLSVTLAAGREVE